MSIFLGHVGDIDDGFLNSEFFRVQDNNKVKHILINQNIQIKLLMIFMKL